jgi:hypothetical protein
MWMVTSSGFTFSVLTIRSRPGSGFCVGAQISTLPSLTDAVQFCGSKVACEMNG